MNYLSVCSGIEAATVAWHPLGWKPLAFSEIEPFPSAVLAHHYPGTPNVGDMTKYKEWNLDGTINLLVGGTPCQSFSVAGLRKGIADPRGNLALTYVGILDHFRPKWCLWENVPGVLSSNGGRDFGSFLGALAELGYGFSYRVLDAQNFGVAQRRRRVFVVGHLGDWKPSAEVLFEPQSLSGNTKQSREKAKDTPTFVESSFGNFRTDDVAGTTKASGGVMGGGSETLVALFEPRSSDGVPRIHGDICPTLNTMQGGQRQPCIAIKGNLIGREKGGPQGIGVSESETMYTLTKTDVHGVVHGTQDPITSDIAHTLGRNGGRENALVRNMSVRRLTPIECERLQGFPDNYSNIPWRKSSESPDGPRYKALGNSMAVPVMRWIGERIQAWENRQ